MITSKHSYDFLKDLIDLYKKDDKKIKKKMTHLLAKLLKQKVVRAHFTTKEQR